MTNDVLELIRIERAKQDIKWGEQNHTDLYWLAIVAEEFGELSKAIVEMYADNAHREKDWTEEIILEAIQTAAVCVVWVETIQRRNSVKK